MNIELLRKTLTVNSKTLAPELDVVLRFPIEAMMDSAAFDPNFYEELGRAIANLLSNKPGQ